MELAECDSWVGVGLSLILEFEFGDTLGFGEGLVTVEGGLGIGLMLTGRIEWCLYLV